MSNGEKKNPLISRLEEEAIRQARIEAGTALAPDIFAAARKLFAKKFPLDVDSHLPHSPHQLEAMSFGDGVELDFTHVEEELTQALREARLDGAKISLIDIRSVEGVGDVAIQIILVKSGDTYKLSLSLIGRPPESVFVLSRNQLVEESTIRVKIAPISRLGSQIGPEYQTRPEWVKGVDVANARGILELVNLLENSETVNDWKLRAGSRSGSWRH